MAFLDRSTLIVDAVLTDKGREELSRNRFEITKFALGDDDVDYTLYNESNSNGPNFYGVAIDNMPVLEAFTNSSEALRYKLITRDTEQPERQPSMSPTIPNSVDLTGNADTATLATTHTREFKQSQFFEMTQRFRKNTVHTVGAESNIPQIA